MSNRLLYLANQLITMNKFFTALLLGILAFAGKAQTPTQSLPGVMPFGKVDVADLEMKTCDFEKDANAEILFNKGNVFFDQQFNIVMEVHKRIKIFNDNGMKQAEIHIPYQGGNRLEFITGLQAQTINLVDGKPEITKLDKKLVYTKFIDKLKNEIAFTFPNVKAGSIIEYKYSWNTVSYGNFPDWFFQQKIPVRYSEFDTSIPEYFTYRTQSRVYEPYVKDESKSESFTGYNNDIRNRAMANIHSLPDEVYMSSYADNLQALVFQLTNITSTQAGVYKSYSDTWGKVGGKLIEDVDFGGQLKRKLKDEELILSKAATLKTSTEKIAYIFSEVKNNMKWDGVDRWYTIDGTAKAWERKSGNSAEVNIILYHLLKQAGIEVYPMVVSTRDHGKVVANYTSLSQFNKAVVYIPLDDDKMYVLDATNKYNSFNDIPADLLNSSGLYVDKSKDVYDIVYLHNDKPVNQTVYVVADIKTDGKIVGVANIRSASYHRKSAVEKYKTDGEKKYIEALKDGDNGLKITAVKFQDIDVDSIPLLQTIDFSLELAGSDENYIILNPNLFSSLKNNPFLAEQRLTDIEFGYNKSYTIGGRYTLPAGYKVDAMPKSGGITMVDKSISFKRTVEQQDGYISLRYTIDFKQPMYGKKSYPDFREFVKVLYQMLNEQIILKKA